MIPALQSGLLALEERRALALGQTWGWADERGGLGELDLPGRVREELQDLSRPESISRSSSESLDKTNWRACVEWQEFDLSRELWGEAAAALQEADSPTHSPETRWQLRWERLAPFREERGNRLKERATEAGFSNWRELSAPDDLPPAILERFSRFVIEPSDDRILAAEQQWRETLRSESETPPLDSRNKSFASSGVEPISFRRWARALHPVARAFGSTALLEAVVPGRGRSGQALASGSPRIWRESSDSVRAALELSEEFGEALRAQFLMDLGAPAAVLTGDPALRWASRWLIRRTWDLPEIGSALGPAARPELRAEFLWEDAVAPRVIWTYVQEGERLGGDLFDADDRGLSRAFSRAQGFGISGAAG